MKRRYTISGIEHVVRLLNQYPQLLALNSFASINQVGQQVKQAVARANCNCAAGPIYAKNRPIFEQALNNLQFGDHLMVKHILNIDELCYFIKDSTGAYKQKCI